MAGSGLATVMLTDLEASTDTTTRLGDDAAARLFSAHDRIVREQLAAHGGHSVHSTGDGFLALFDSARAGVACALDIQRELAARDDGVRVRIGLNAGEVQEGEDGALFGAAINLASRVMDRADGGEILVTDTVRQLVGTMPDARFRERGRVALKGFPDRIRLHEAQPAAGRIPTRAPPKRARRSHRRQLAAAGLAVVVVAVAAALVATRGAEAVRVGPNSVAVLDPANGRVIAQVPVGVRPAELAVSRGSVWVSNLGDKTVTRIGARSRKVLGTDAPGIDLDGLGAGPSGIWVAEDERSLARVIDPAFRTVARTYRIARAAPGGDRPVAVTADAVWISNGFGVVRLDPSRRRTVAVITLGNSPSGIATAAGAVWVSDDIDGTVSRIDPETNDVIATIAVGASASGIAAGAGGVWVAVPFEDRVKRIDPATNAIAEVVRVAGGPAELALGSDAVWVTSRRGTVSRIDPQRMRVAYTVRVGNSPQGVAVAGGAVWVAVQAGAASAAASTEERAGEVLRVLRPGFFGSTDPAEFTGNEAATQYATCAPLLQLPDRPFPAGAQYRPEAAAALPAVTDGGRTYTFHVRRGFRFSPPSGAPVTAAAFERTLERILHRAHNPFFAAIMSDIAGVRAYRAGRTKRIAGVTARGQTLVIRLREPSTTLNARLANPWTCAVPPSTPIRVAGGEPIPTAGPYYYASYARGRRVVLRRNPNYGGTRPARFREIEVVLDVSEAATAAVVLAGRADYAMVVPPSRLAALERRFGAHSTAARTGRQRYFSGPLPVVHFFMFNRRRGIFARRSERLAANAVLDRAALAAAVPAGGLAAGVPGRPTDQLVAPGLPGFRDVAIHPLGGPDPAVVDRLARGRRPRRAVLYTCNNPPCLQEARVARRDLAAIGIDLEVKAFAFPEMFERLGTRGEPWDLGYSPWFPDYADAANTIAGLFASGIPLPGSVRDAALERRIRAAVRLPDAARARAIARIDADLVRSAAVAPFATNASTDFFSDGIGCQVHQPIYGISLGALCIRR